MPPPATIPAGRWLVPGIRSVRKHYFVHGERFSMCQNAKRDTARTCGCAIRCATCVRVMKSKK